jgi:hypothetical protein
MEESYPAPQERMLKALKFLREREDLGATWFELGEHYGWHHGQSSAVLSTLHREERIARLTEKRGRSYVYVDQYHVNDRPTGRQGRNQTDYYETGYRDGYSAGYQDGINTAKAMAMLILNNVNTPLTIHDARCWRNHPGCAVKAVLKQIDVQSHRRAA